MNFYRNSQPIPKGWKALGVVRQPRYGDYHLTIRGTVAMCADSEYDGVAIILVPESPDVLEKWNRQPGRQWDE